jgi:hypothetical protein
VLRHAVIWRKLSFGTQSAGGSRFLETMLSVTETCPIESQPAGLCHRGRSCSPHQTANSFTPVQNVNGLPWGARDLIFSPSILGLPAHILEQRF